MLLLILTLLKIICDNNMIYDAVFDGMIVVIVVIDVIILLMML